MQASSNLNLTKTSTTDIDPKVGGCVDTKRLLHDVFENVGPECVENEDFSHDFVKGDTENEDNDFILHLFHLKSMHGCTIKSFDMLLKLLVSVFLDVNLFLSSWNKCKQLNKDLGFQCEKIHSCLNDCILYWGRRENQDECDKCRTSRWMDKDRRLPNKVLRYFPLIPRLLRMYKSSRIAKDMIWHHKDRTNDGILRHPADGEAWKDFDERLANYASDPQNVKLGLASD
ncbi:unnamed protein product [Amaranthus hypochondriacus]